MRYTDVRNKYQLSNTAFGKLIRLGIIAKDEESGGYITPWKGIQLFKPIDVSKFLSRHSGEHWTIDRLLYVHKNYFFDVHQKKGEKALYRITIHEFLALIEKDFPGLKATWEQAFAYYLAE